MVKPVFLKSIVFFVTFDSENFYGLFRMSSFHAHTKLKISNLCCLNQLFIAYLLFYFSEYMRKMTVLGKRGGRNIFIFKNFGGRSRFSRTFAVLE